MSLFHASLKTHASRLFIAASLVLVGPRSAQGTTVNYTSYSVSTLAGSAGSPGNVNGTGLNAQFDSPYAIAADPSGNVYVAESGNHDVRKITAAGVVTTVSGLTGNFRGIAIDSTGINLYLTDYTAGTVIKYVIASGVATTLTLTGGTLNNPYGLAVDSSGNLYVADAGNYVIRKISPSGSVSTLAGSIGSSGGNDGTATAAQFSYPTSVAVDGTGTVFVADWGGNTIRKVTASGVVTTLGGLFGLPDAVDGAAVGSQFSHPWGIAIDGSGNLFVTDNGSYIIRKISSSLIVSTLAGKFSSPGQTDGSADTARFYDPRGIAVNSSGALFITDTQNQTIRKAVATSVSIGTQPTSQTVNSGSTATLTVSATGTGPFTYQWQKVYSGSLTNGTLSDGTVIAGATASTLTLSNVQTAEAGNYFVTVTNGSGSVQSSTVTLTVNASASLPVITTHPASQTVTAGANVSLSVVATGSGLTYQWQFNGVAISGQTSSILTLSSITTAQAGSYAVAVTNSAGSATSNTATLTVNPSGSQPAITTQPTSQTVNTGSTATFTVAATGSGLGYQWQFNGSAISGATNSTLTLTGVTAAQAGSYTVVVSNGIGSATSNGAVLAVQSTGAPLISSQPQAQTIASGSTVVLAVTTSGTVTITSANADGPRPAATGAASSYQWYRNGVAVSGATSATLVVSNATSSNAGGYRCLVSNSSGSTLSSEAVVSIISTSNPGRLINLSVNAKVNPSIGIPDLIMGFVTGGSGTTGSQTLMIRAGGPALVPYGVSGVLPDPELTVFNGSTSIASNAGWETPSSNVALVNAAQANTGAGLVYANTSSLDSAVVLSLGASPGYTVQVDGKAGDSGQTLAEVYDDTPANTYFLTTPRLVNLSCRITVPANGSLTDGFYIGGATSKTVLIRAIGPGLAAYGVSGAMSDPVLTVNAGSTVIATNSGWGSDPQLTAAMTAVSAQPNPPAIGDSVVLVTLAPGSYTAVATSAGGSAGNVLLDIYEVP